MTDIPKKFEGIKFDEDKPRFDLLPPNALLEVAKIYQHGAKKYGDRNWENGLMYSRLYRAALGHLVSWWSGESLDPDSKLSNLSHAAFNVLGLLEYELTKRKELDNRPKGESE